MKKEKQPEVNASKDAGEKKTAPADKNNDTTIHPVEKEKNAYILEKDENDNNSTIGIP